MPDIDLKKTLKEYTIKAVVQLYGMVEELQQQSHNIKNTELFLAKLKLK